jgi:transposase
MMTSYEKRLEKEFVENGGIKERMTAARLNQRESQRQIIDRQAQEIAALKQEIARLKKKLDDMERLDRR